MRIQGINILEHTMRITVTFLFYQIREKIVFIFLVFLSQGNIRESKKVITNNNKFSMKINLPVEFNRDKYNLNYKSHIYKIKTMR